jgi:hypothetical protein
MMSKMRSLADIGQLFFIADDTKIKGNRAYDQGLYYEAMDAYEQVLGCFIWLEPKDTETFYKQVFEDFDFMGITDGEVVLKEKQVVREDDREFEV